MLETNTLYIVSITSVYISLNDIAIESRRFPPITALLTDSPDTTALFSAYPRFADLHGPHPSRSVREKTAFPQTSRILLIYRCRKDFSRDETPRLRSTAIESCDPRAQINETQRERRGGRGMKRTSDCESINRREIILMRFCRIGDPLSFVPHFPRYSRSVRSLGD